MSGTVSSMSEAWNLFARHIDLAEACADQRTDMQIAFFSGALSFDAVMSAAIKTAGGNESSLRLLLATVRAEVQAHLKPVLDLEVPREH